MVLTTKYCVILAVGCAAILLFSLIRVLILTNDDEEQYKEACTTFGRIYSVVVNSSDETINHVWSPLGLELMLAMIYAVAENKSTAPDLRNVLEWTAKSDEDMPHDLKNKVDVTSKALAPPSVNASLVTGGFIDDQLGNIFATHEKQVLNTFIGNTHHINLEHASIAAESLNAWVKRETGGRIETLLNASDLLGRRLEPKRIEMVVVNALYFEAEWEPSFFQIKSRTGNRFYTDSKTHVHADFWSNKGYFRHAEIKELSAEAVRIPFKGRKFSIIAILPHKFSDVASLEKKIAQGYQLTSLALELEWKIMLLHLPTFDMETTLNFGEMLEISEIGCGFEKSNNKNPSISQVHFVNAGALFQKTVLRVKHGHEFLPFLLNDTITVMRFDRPFIAYILEESTNTIVVMFRKVN